MSHLYIINKMNFLIKLHTIDNRLINFIANEMNHFGIWKLSTRYGVVDYLSFVKKFQATIRNKFKEEN
jgi:hypothetical protein